MFLVEIRLKGQPSILSDAYSKNIKPRNYVDNQHAVANETIVDKYT